jgi:Tol biopolymer transport system component
MSDPTVTSDGKRLAFRKSSPQGTVYVADVEGNGGRISTARRLTLNDGENYPVGWTPDSKAVVFESYRDGERSIFKQLLDEDTAEPIVTGAEDKGGASSTVSPNGAWLLYIAPSTKSSSASASGMDRLMRVSMRGGPPALVMTARIYGKTACATSPGNFCAIAEPTTDHKHLIFTAFDPEKGRGTELTRFDIDPTTSTRYVWDLSPDGRRIAILKYGNRFIDVLPLDGQARQKIVAKNWNSLLSLNWESGGKGIFASSQTKKGSVLLRVSLDGDAQVVWEQSGSIAPWNRPFVHAPSAPWGVPSPNGRHMAIYGWNMSSNMWMIENF